MERIELHVVDEERRMRLEDFLFRRFAALSRMYLREVIKTEKCEVNGRYENRGYRLRANDFVEIVLDPRRENSMRPENIPLTVIFEDDEILVVHKPTGMLVHPTHRDRTGTLLNALTFHLNYHQTVKRDVCRQNGPIENNAHSHRSVIRPGLVHRLDKETSGLMVIAKNVRAHRILARQFQSKTVTKKYLALVGGEVRESSGEISEPIGRFADRKFWDLKSDGKPALTRFKVKKRFPDATLLELEPVTGRTNQLRIHCRAIGHPVAGDIERSGPIAARLCLHAYALEFRHPKIGRQLRFESGGETDFSEFV
jgi:23S rRNA pseudouridine1911/1915/1917 synthase